ncbi:MAG: hypothetical protein GXP35_12735 [Actinobacteria bacterium]|nr:hypothetical protein [Actinomycetota bacterium]
MRRFLIALALGLVTASCTTTGTARTVADELDTTVHDLIAEGNAATKPPPTGDSSVSDNDIEELRTVLFGGGGADSELTLHLRHEEILVDCMADQGFEYVAMPYAGSLSSPRLDTSLDADEFAELYGFGRSTLFEVEELASAVVAATHVDPNESLRNAMSDSERTAYLNAFFGPPAPGSSSEDGSYRPADRRAGCNGEAAAVYGGVQSFDISDEARDALLSIARRSCKPIPMFGQPKTSGLRACVLLGTMSQLKRTW